MKFIIMLLVAMIPVIAAASQSSATTQISAVEGRNSGYHAVYIAAGGVPDEGCDRTDRAVIDPTSSPGAKKLLSVALTALNTGGNVVLTVDGCTPITGGTSQTSPTVVGIRLLAE